MVTIKWEGVYWFFGAKTQKTFKPVWTPLEFNRCKNSIAFHSDPDLGPLVDLGDGYYSTSNTIIPKYSWTMKTIDMVQNVRLVLTTIRYDHILKKMYTPLEELVGCNVAHGICRTIENTFIWN